MLRIKLIGIGMGNPGHLTFEARDALQEADLIIIPDKGAQKQDLADMRRDILDVHVPNAPKVVDFPMPKRDAKTKAYLDGVSDWHDAIAQIWSQTIATHLGDHGTVALMVWGDPMLYDSTIRIAERLDNVRIEVLPGVTSIQLLCAAHGIPLNGLGNAVTITTGRTLRTYGWPPETETIVVLLDGETSFQSLEGAFDIWWGAYLGMPNQILMQGDLSEIANRIVDTRAAAREEHGWIMDTYLIRKRDI
jgi:precorrin-6A synthase